MSGHEWPLVQCGSINFIRICAGMLLGCVGGSGAGGRSIGLCTRYACMACMPLVCAQLLLLWLAGT